jgi:hypothetical protein
MKANKLRTERRAVKTLQPPPTIFWVYVGGSINTAVYLVNLVINHVYRDSRRTRTGSGFGIGFR